jgi:cell division protein FtsQ
VTVTEEVQEQQAPIHKRSRKPLIVGIAGLALVGGVAVYAAGWTSVMGVKAIEVEGSSSVPASELIETADIAPGTPMMKVDLRAATARLADLPQLASVDVRRVWPRTVVLEVTERNAVVVQRSGDSWELVDSDGVPFAIVAQRPKNLPTMQRSSDEAANTAMLQALNGMSDEVREQVASITAASPESIRLTLRRSDAVVNWGGPQQSEYKSEVLAILLGVKAGWYDVSNPDTPATAPTQPGPAPSVASTDAATVAPSGGPDAVVTPSPEPTPTPSAPATPAPVESAVGVVPQND